MTVRELLGLCQQHPLALLALGLLPPLLVAAVGRLHAPGRGGASPWRHVYAVLIYVACVPGMGAAVLTGYTLFFTRESLLDANLLVYGLPILSMVATLVLIRKRVGFDEVPGFDRLSGLMVLLAVTFVLLLVVHKTFIGILFGAGIGTLILLGIAAFALLKWGARTLLRSSDEPRAKPPTSPLP